MNRLYTIPDTNNSLKKINFFKIGFIVDTFILNVSTGVRSLILSYIYNLNKSGKYENFLINIDKNNSIYALPNNQYLLDRGITSNICMGKTKTEIISNITKYRTYFDLAKSKKNTQLSRPITRDISFDAVFLSEPDMFCRYSFSNFNCRTYCISHDNFDLLAYFQHPSSINLSWSEVRKLGLNFSDTKDGIICTTKESRRHLEVLGFGKNRGLKTMPIVMPPGYEKINLSKEPRKACILAAPFNFRKNASIIPKLLNNSSYEQIIIYGSISIRNILEVLNFFNEIETDNIEWWPYVTYEKQIELYSRSKTLLFPSQIEGLGIPVLEAMACGCSTLIFDIPPINELVHPEDILPDNLEGACLKVAEHSKKSIDHEKYQQRLYNFLQSQGNFETEFSKLLK